MSSPSAPVIGVVADHKTIQTSVGPRTFVGVYATYLNCLVDAGAAPLLIPLGLSSPALNSLFQRLDGLLLTGGGDLDPACYGQTTRHPTVSEINPARDETELLLSRWAAEQDVPLLGICRGQQVVNVALGGTLYQDIPAEIGTTVEHDTPGPLDHYAHEVRVAPGSRLAGLVGSTSLATNSRHHQAVREPAPGLAVTAHAPDGVIEALEKADARFIVTVQWHPENLRHDPATRALFRGLVEAATRYREDRSGAGPADGR